MKKDKNPGYISIGIFTIITTISWIFFSAYRTLTAKPAPTLSSQILTSFSPNLDTAQVEEMQGRIFFEEGQTQSAISQNQTPTPEPSPTAEPDIPSPTGQPEEVTTSGEVTE